MLINSAEDYWNNTTPEERVCNSTLEYLSEEILLSDWNSLSKHVQGHLIILLS